MRITFLFLTVCFWYFDLFAQTNTFTGGLTLGINSAQIQGDGYGGFDKVGPILGGFVATDVGEKWKAQLEISYINKGSKDPPNAKINKFNFYRINLHYIEVPLVFQYPLKKIKLEVGGAYARLFRESHSDANGSIIPIIGPIRQGEISYVVGAAYPFGKKLWLHWRYQASLLPIASNVVFDKVRLGFFGGAYNIGVNFTLKYSLGKEE